MVSSPVEAASLISVRGSILSLTLSNLYHNSGISVVLHIMNLTTTHERENHDDLVKKLGPMRATIARKRIYEVVNEQGCRRHSASTTETVLDLVKECNKKV